MIWIIAVAIVLLIAVAIYDLTLSSLDMAAASDDRRLRTAKRCVA